MTIVWFVLRLLAVLVAVPLVIVAWLLAALGGLWLPLVLFALGGGLVWFGVAPLFKGKK